MKYLAVLVFLSVALTGCKSTPYKTPLVHKSPTSVTLYSLVTQQEIEADVPVQDSSAVSAQYGLVGMLVSSAMDSSVNNSNANRVQTNLAPIRDQLMQLDVKQAIHEAMQGIKLDGHPIAINKVVAVNSFDEIDAQVQQGETYLMVNTDYRLDVAFKRPYFASYVTLRTKSDAKEPVILYKNKFKYFGPGVPHVTEKSQADIDAEVAEINAWYAGLDEDEKQDVRNRSKYLKSMKWAKKTSMDADEMIEAKANFWASAEYLPQLVTFLTTAITEHAALIEADMLDSTTVETLASQPANKKQDHIVWQEDEDRTTYRSMFNYHAGAVCSYPAEAKEELSTFTCQ